MLYAGIRCLWEKEEKARVDLRDKPHCIRHAIGSRQFINNLPPIAQAKLWNSSKLLTYLEPDEFKTQSKEYYLQKYYDQAETTIKTEESKTKQTIVFYNRDHKKSKYLCSIIEGPSIKLTRSWAADKTYSKLLIEEVIQASHIVTKYRN